MKKSTILVFVLTYALFSISGFLFQLDPTWYEALAKPSFTPSGSFIGMVWIVLYALISLAVAILHQKIGLQRISGGWLALFILNYVLNQAFSYFQFEQKDLYAAFLDCLGVAATTLLLVIFTPKYSKAAAWLFVPYLLWSSFATYLSWLFYTMNR
ncbi:TspO/MBR family protein [Aneurinibacillus sp. REN35]|uniref:TspO/MBR family protein n=1 Tax=Aneurinibacillus sp. REN35 TaxID=3237286 RepID=UPI003527C4DE